MIEEDAVKTETAGNEDSVSKKPRAKRIQTVRAPEFKKVVSQYPAKVLWAKLAIRDFMLRCKLYPSPQSFAMLTI